MHLGPLSKSLVLLVKQHEAFTIIHSSVAHWSAMACVSQQHDADERRCRDRVFSVSTSPSAPKLCIAFTFDAERHGNEREFYEGSALFRLCTGLGWHRGAFCKCSFKPEVWFDLLCFPGYRRSLSSSVSPSNHTGRHMCELQLIQSTMTVLSTQRETLISAPNTSAFSSQAK